MDIPLIFEMLERSKIDPYDPADIENFPTIYLQTGAKRRGPVSLHQDHDTLLKITKYNYDWTVPQFQEYCRARGVPCFDIRNFADVPESAQIHAGKMQDCWELWLREIRALNPENYDNQGPTRQRRIQKLLSTIYKYP